MGRFVMMLVLAASLAGCGAQEVSADPPCDAVCCEERQMWYDAAVGWARTSRDIAIGTIPCMDLGDGHVGCGCQDGLIGRMTCRYVFNPPEGE